VSPRGPRFAPSMGGFGLPPFTPAVKWLIVATVAVSILVPLSGREIGGAIETLLAFCPGALRQGRVWTLFTYTFLNPDPFMLILAGLSLWMMGGSLEAMWGTKKFLFFYFASSVIAALATAVVAIFSPIVANSYYAGNWTVLEALAAAFAVALPTARIFLYFFPVEARLLLPISGGITLLYMIFRGWPPYLPQLFGLGAGALLAGGRLRTPRQLLLRLRVFWIDRRLRSRNLRVVREGKNDDDAPRRGSRGSDKYLH
jgi:membrane associated rhomboid family serine protease